MIVVLHRERSERLARRFYEALNEVSLWQYDWNLLTSEIQENCIAAMDALIQDGLICEKQHRPEGRE